MRSLLSHEFNPDRVIISGQKPWLSWNHDCAQVTSPSRIWSSLSLWAQLLPQLKSCVQITQVFRTIDPAELYFQVKSVPCIVAQTEIICLWRTQWGLAILDIRPELILNWNIAKSRLLMVCFSVQLSSHIAILQGVWQWYCRTMCNFFKWFDKWGDCFGTMTFEFKISLGRISFL